MLPVSITSSVGQFEGTVQFYCKLHLFLSTSNVMSCKGIVSFLWRKRESDAAHGETANCGFFCEPSSSFCFQFLGTEFTSVGQTGHRSGATWAWSAPARSPTRPPWSGGGWRARRSWVLRRFVVSGVTTNHCWLYVRDPRDSIYPRRVRPVITILPLYSCLRRVNFTK